MYKITTYPDGTLTTSISKADAGKRCLSGIVEEFASLEALTFRASKVPISPSELKDGYRAGKNFIQTNLIVVDIDDHLSMNEAACALDAHGYEFGIYTSFSHTEEKNKFHVIIPLQHYITSEEDYKATYANAAKTIFGESNDGQTCSPANLFFNSNPNTVNFEFSRSHDSISKFPVVKSKATAVTSSTSKVSPTVEGQARYKILSTKTLKFLKAGAEPGKWHGEIILAAKNLKAAGFTIEETVQEIFDINEHLDASDKYQIEAAYANDSWNYNIEGIPSEIHPLREKYYDKVKRKPLQIPEQEIVATFMIEKCMDIKVDGRLLINGEFQDITYVLEEIRHFAQTKLQANTNITTLSSVINKISTDVRLKRFEQLKDHVKFDNSPFDFETLMEVVTGNRSHLDVAILKHFIWQTKRKMFKKEVKYHTMPVYVGRSNSGKSYHVRHHLLQPISEIVYFDGDFKKLVDSREAFNLCTNYVYLMDEMSKADHADVESIKNKITAPTIQYRRLGTNITSQGDNKATFIGTSNNPIEDIIKDPTSIRRFYQIDTVREIDRVKINEFDYLAMWRSIDENQDDAPYILPVLREVQDKQEEFRHRSPFEHYVSEYGYDNKESEKSERIDRIAMYNEFKEWSIQNGYRYSTTKHIFLRTLAAAFGSPFRGRVDGDIKQYYFRTKKTEDQKSS